ncbi:hypothetical protein C8F01DRAFT_1053814 [Mycena amicta]|nr:hypothetical protein C8F01DRAFT_1053814 [Mycena amicta]
MSAPWPIKRQRSETPVLGLIPARSSVVWFEDGNILLEGQNRLFRVYRGMLATQSPVWKANLEIIPETDGETPVLTLDDAGEDLEHVLKTIFHPWTRRDTEPLSFTVISAYARLGRKYQIPALFDDAVRRLSEAFPSTLDRLLNSQVLSAISPTDPHTLVIQKEIVIETIILARELDVPVLLPSAFWVVSGTQTLDLLANPRAALLSEQDKAAILRAPQPRGQAYAKHLYSWLEIPGEGCEKEEECMRAKMQIRLNIWLPDGLTRRLCWSDELKEGLCESCGKIGKTAHERGARQLWLDMPSIFGLPSWEELLRIEEQ